jgi:hypothetical protein
MYIAVSAAGCYRTDDGGQTWNPFNKNVRADFMPNKFPEFGQCVHKMAMHASNPNLIYQQITAASIAVILLAKTGSTSAKANCLRALASRLLSILPTPGRCMWRWRKVMSFG